jgi:isopenicillin-N epimerase
LWKTKKIRIRGGEPSKLRLSTPYYLQEKDLDRFLDSFDEYKRDKKIAFFSRLFPTELGRGLSKT